MRSIFCIPIILLLIIILIAGCTEIVSTSNGTVVTSSEGINQTYSFYRFSPDPTLQMNSIVYNISKKPEYVSGTLTTPAGKVSFNAWINDSATSIPVFRINNSEMFDISIDRYAVAISPYLKDKENYQKIIKSLPDEQNAITLSEKVLQPFGGVPYDASEPKFSQNIGIDPSAFYSTVRYYRSINGLSVEGSGIDGDNIWVDFGQNGDLIRLNKKWRKIDYIQNEAVIPISTALTRLQKGEAVNKIWANDVFNSIRLGYYDNPEISDIPEPVWIFSGKNQWGGNTALYIYAAERGPVSVALSQTLPKVIKTSSNNYEILHNSSAKRPVTGHEAVDIVKKFIGKPNSIVTYERTEHTKAGCGGYSYDTHILSSSEGKYGVYPDTGEIMYVEYKLDQNGSPSQNVNISQAISISQKFLAGKFSGFNEHPSSFSATIFEDENTFSLYYGDAPMIEVSKNTGQVLGYYDGSMIEHYQC